MNGRMKERTKVCHSCDEMEFNCVGGRNVCEVTKVSRNTILPTKEFCVIKLAFHAWESIKDFSTEFAHWVGFRSHWLLKKNWVSVQNVGVTIDFLCHSQHTISMVVATSMAKKSERTHASQIDLYACSLSLWNTNWMEITVSFNLAACIWSILVIFLSQINTSQWQQPTGD